VVFAVAVVGRAATFGQCRVVEADRAERGAPHRGSHADQRRSEMLGREVFPERLGLRDVRGQQRGGVDAALCRDILRDAFGGTPVCRGIVVQRVVEIEQDGRQGRADRH